MVAAFIGFLAITTTSCNLDEWNKLSPYEQQYLLERVQTPPVVREALSNLGKPYKWGATGPSAFDCSGLILYSYGKQGINLPHSARALRAMSKKVVNPEPGDLVFYGTHHVGMYVGGGQVVHAPRTGDVVKVSSLRKGAYIGRVA